ncbi:MAG: hypothetical protein JO359_07675 [Candidatus Eremiobacteraeota bacterium]|nr:hypothetical protein [Candidatus Eremiobacteraeota bacterium]
MLARLCRALTGALVVLLLQAFSQAGAAVVYEAPAQNLPAGHFGTDPFSAVLPSGRLIRPQGRSAVVGMNALGVALTPDGRFAIVSNDDERLGDARSLLDPSIAGGYSLSVVDVDTMRVVSQYVSEDATYFSGIVATRDPAAPQRTLVAVAGGGNDSVSTFILSPEGKLVPDARIAIPGPIDPLFADAGKTFPGTLVLSADGAIAYAVNNLASTVSAIDLRARRLLTTRPVGFFPFGAALTPSADELLVCNEGLMRYGVLPQPVPIPPFRTPPADSTQASSLSFVPVAAGGDLAASPAGLARVFPGALALDRAPDGLRIAGGAHPNAVVVTRDGSYAFVALANVDRIAVVALQPAPHVIDGLDLRLFPRGPYGTQPSALALGRDGRLYVALAGLNAVAVLDARVPARLRRLGLIPTGWYPTALALSGDERTLFVTNAKGFGADPAFVGDKPIALAPNGRVLAVAIDSNAVWSTLERIDLAGLELGHQTYATLGSTRVSKTLARNDVVPPLGSGASKKLKHVIVILEENKTFDSMLGDLVDGAGRQHGNGDPSLVSFDATVTPNLHALARTYGVADNFYSDAQESDAGHQFVLGGIASDFTERTLLVRKGRRPLINKNEDPEDYPRFGYIFNSLALHKLSYRDYGDLVRQSGYDEGSNADPKVDDPNFVDVDDRTAPTSGLGGLYSLDAPAPAILRGHVDLRYPGWNLRIRDERRAREFVRDFDLLAAEDKTPRYTFVWLPDDHGGFGKFIPPLAEEVADGDRALGIIVSHITRMPIWKDTAIFVLPDDSQSTRDHVNVERSYAVVVSPYAKRGFVGHRHLSTASVLKTEEELLGLPPLSLGELLATDLADFFTARPNFAPYTAKPVATQTASAEGIRIAALLEGIDQSAADADPVRTGTLVDLSRRADRLARERLHYRPSEYAAMQGALFARALAVVRDRGGE